MFAGERELYQRFVAYDDEELLRILTVERAHYRSEALAAAETILVQRGVATPTFFDAPWPPPATHVNVNVKGRAKSPYKAIDLVVDALLFGFLYWVTSEMDVGSVLPESWLADGAVRLLFVSLLTLGVMYLRQVWRTKVW